MTDDTMILERYFCATKYHDAICYELAYKRGLVWNGLRWSWCCMMHLWSSEGQTVHYNCLLHALLLPYTIMSNATPSLSSYMDIGYLPVVWLLPGGRVSASARSARHHQSPELLEARNWILILHKRAPILYWLQHTCNTWPDFFRFHWTAKKSVLRCL